MNTVVRHIILESMEHDMKHGEAPHDAKYGEDGSGLPWEKFAKMLMNAEPFVAYIKKHGYHFTCALADCATKMMDNDDGSHHNWTTAQVKAVMEAQGMSLGRNCTWGDAAYVANMIYADFYPDVAHSEHDCLMAAHKQMHDVDGYDGMIFARWLSDVVGKEVEINWEIYNG